MHSHHGHVYVGGVELHVDLLIDQRLAALRVILEKLWQKI